MSATERSSGRARRALMFIPAREASLAFQQSQHFNNLNNPKNTADS